VVPRLLLIGGEPNFLAPLVDLEWAVETLNYNAWLDARFGLPEGAVAADLADLLRALAEGAQRRMGHART
jgi:hypothetical protein